MKIERFLKKVFALTLLCVGAIPFVNNTGAYAQEGGKPEAENRWLDDPHAKVGLTYGVKATVNSAYIWRGLHAGGCNIQIDANVGYGGAYIDTWWNLGANNAYTAFQPEMDWSIGFNRWGVDIHLLWVYNFDCPLFDFGNYPNKGSRLELNAAYTVSSKIPLTIHWATRVGASDAYVEEKTADDGQQVLDTVQAYSSFAEISYTQHLRDGFSLYGSVGITPWRSCYTGYMGGFALNNIDLRLRKDWTVHERIGLMLMAQLVVNPAAPVNVIMPNIGFGVYLK